MVERHFHTVYVTGSNPVIPTNNWKNEPSWTNGSYLENSRSLKTAWGFESLFFRKQIAR